MRLSKDEIREAAEGSLAVFAALVNPTYVYGEIHQTVFRHLENNDRAQLLLLPRGHLKSHCIAVWAAWWITKHPSTTIVYVSATDKLVLQQMYAIKQMLESDVYRRYWPDMIFPEEARREKWSATEIKVDHPKRKEQGVRDATLMLATVKTNTTGLHCDVLIYDDVVVPDNAYTEGGRGDVAAAVSQFSSIANPGAIVKAVGTRYHPKDVYGTWEGTEVEMYDEAGNVTGFTKRWSIFQKPVMNEDSTFLWPRTYSPKTKKWYGYNNSVLAVIRAEYFSQNQRAQYYAQYFNNANHRDEAEERKPFQYYNREKLLEIDGVWHYNYKPLALYLGGDFAYTTGQRSDYTAYAVIGVTPDNFKLIVDLVQFKTDKYERFFSELFELQRKWSFKKGKLEVNAGANVIVSYIRDRIREEGLMLSLEVANSVTNKAERTAAIVEPEYGKQAVLHYKGGWMSEFEEQLTLARPAHDDLRDAVTIAFSIAKPAKAKQMQSQQDSRSTVIHARFGGRGR